MWNDRKLELRLGLELDCLIPAMRKVLSLEWLILVHCWEIEWDDERSGYSPDY